MNKITGQVTGGLSWNFVNREELVEFWNVGVQCTCSCSLSTGSFIVREGVGSYNTFYRGPLSPHSATPTPTSSPTSSRGSSRECRRVGVQLATGITSGNRACRTCRRGSSRGRRCRCRRRGMRASVCVDYSYASLYGA